METKNKLQKVQQRNIKVRRLLCCCASILQFCSPLRRRVLEQVLAACLLGLGTDSKNYNMKDNIIKYIVTESVYTTNKNVVRS